LRFFGFSRDFLPTIGRASVARHRGVRRFVADVLAQNQRMIHVIADAGLTYRIHNGLILPSLAVATRDALARLLPVEASVHNPVDTTASVDADVSCSGGGRPERHPPRADQPALTEKPCWFP
jgi:hypothetical protein